ncbi:hypothetical protein AVEN_75278-1, partial [Araneus ventricosus]
ISSNGDQRQEKLHESLRRCFPVARDSRGSNGCFAVAGREEVSSGKTTAPPSVEDPWKEDAGR